MSSTYTTTQLIPITPISISIKDYLIACLSFKYISNATIITSLIAYYTNAYYIFFITIPLMITNMIIILLVQWFNMPELINGIFSNKIKNDSDNNVDFDDTSIFKFAILNILWHLIPILWLYSVLHRDNLIDIFKPNFMGIFLICCVISIFYFYYSIKMNIYGNINYIWYGALYMLILFICCITIFNNNQ